MSFAELNSSAGAGPDIVRALCLRMAMGDPTLPLSRRASFAAMLANDCPDALDEVSFGLAKAAQNPAMDAEVVGLAQSIADEARTIRDRMRSN